MTRAEKRFKAVVAQLIGAGTYPGTTSLCRALGFNSLRPDLNGQEMVWRRQELERLGWRFELHGSTSWTAPNC
jgi:hypothetical protein